MALGTFDDDALEAGSVSDGSADESSESDPSDPDEVLSASDSFSDGASCWMKKLGLLRIDVHARGKP